MLANGVKMISKPLCPCEGRKMTFFHKGYILVTYGKVDKGIYIIFLIIGHITIDLDTVFFL